MICTLRATVKYESVSVGLRWFAKRVLLLATIALLGCSEPPNPGSGPKQKVRLALGKPKAQSTPLEWSSLGGTSTDAVVATPIEAVVVFPDVHDFACTSLATRALCEQGVVRIVKLTPFEHAKPFSEAVHEVMRIFARFDAAGRSEGSQKVAEWARSGDPEPKDDGLTAAVDFGYGESVFAKLKRTHEREKWYLSLTFSSERRPFGPEQKSIDKPNPSRSPRPGSPSDGLLRYPFEPFQRSSGDPRPFEAVPR